MFVFLTLLPPGASISFLNGQIEKVTEDTLRLIIDANTYHRIADDFLTESTEHYSEIFEEGMDYDDEESDDG